MCSLRLVSGLRSVGCRCIVGRLCFTVRLRLVGGWFLVGNLYFVRGLCIDN